MAQNRIYLKCRVCGAKLFLGKNFGGSYFYTNYFSLRDKNAPSLEQQLNEFYHHHNDCGLGTIEWHFGSHYDIEYEDEPIWRNQNKGDSQNGTSN